MERKYWVLETVEAVQDAIKGSSWGVWAKLKGQQDAPIIDESSIRVRAGTLEVNAGEYYAGKGHINEEWIAPLFVFAKHPCDGCHYPPHMCCLQPASFRSSGDYDYGGYLTDEADTDDEIMSSEEYEEAIAQRDQAPALAVLKSIEV